MTPTRTQAELDAAVIEAAESVERWWKSHADGTYGQSYVGKVPPFPPDVLKDAIRVRREAMKPCKGALLLTIARGNASLYFSDGLALSLWDEVSECVRQNMRTWLARIDAAPDEPSEVQS